MENMLHLAPSHASLPDCFVVPPGGLPPSTAAEAAAVSLPVIDLSRGRDEVRRAILAAGKEFGFFQVVNHGVCEQALRDMAAVSDEFFRLPVADKAHLYSDDTRRPNRLFSGSTFKTSSQQYWMDCLRLACSIPAGDSSRHWPDKPHNLREVFQRFIELTRGVGMELLQLLSEGLGLRSGFFEGDLSGGDVVLSVIQYPPCPNPGAALGLPPHCDRNLLTLVLSGQVPGLEVRHGGDWIKVEPLPGAFVVNFGLQIEVVTNGTLKSVEHRVVTNAARARTSLVTSIAGTPDCLLGPAPEFVGEGNPPAYRTVALAEFMRVYNQSLEKSQGDLKEHMKPFRL